MRVSTSILNTAEFEKSSGLIFSPIEMVAIPPLLKCKTDSQV